MSFEESLESFEQKERSSSEYKDLKNSDYCYCKQLQFVALDKSDSKIPVKKDDFLVVCVGINYGQYNPVKAGREDKFNETGSIATDFEGEDNLKYMRERVSLILKKWGRKENKFNILYTNLLPIITRKGWSDYSSKEQKKILEFSEKFTYLIRLKEEILKKHKIFWIFHTKTNTKKAFEDLKETLKILNKSIPYSDNLATPYFDIDRLKEI